MIAQRKYTFVKNGVPPWKKGKSFRTWKNKIEIKKEKVLTTTTSSGKCPLWHTREEKINK